MNLAKSVDLRSGMPPVYDQGQCGSCTAQAISAAIEYDEKKQGLPSFPPSKLFIYFNERKLEGNVATDTGASLRDGIKTIAHQGYCSESMWPYDVTQFATCPPLSCYKAALDHRAVNYKRVPQSLMQLQDVLSTGFPIVCGISVYESFESDETIQSGNVPYPEKTEKMLGGHGIILCGYNTTQRTFTFRNSWGTSFGDNGYGTIPFNYIVNPDLTQDFWVVTRITAPSTNVLTATDTATDTATASTSITPVATSTLASVNENKNDEDTQKILDQSMAW
jgi:C1A family cysteine protease